jgi:hypothetical protein
MTKKRICFLKSKTTLSSNMYSIPDAYVNPGVGNVPRPIDAAPVFGPGRYVNAEEFQIQQGFQRDKEIHARRSTPAPDQVSLLPKNHFDERENYLMSLYAKQNMVPQPTRSLSRRQTINNPNKIEVERREMPILQGNFENYIPGDYRGDKTRSRFKEIRERVFDGRITQDGEHVATHSTGVEVMARQSPYEAIQSRALEYKQARREVQASIERRNVIELGNRAVAAQWQGPSAIPGLGTGANARIARRSNTKKSHPGYITGNVNQNTFSKPGTDHNRELGNTLEYNRREVSGSLTKVARPFHESVNRRRRNQEVKNDRLERTAGTYDIAGVVTLGGRKGALENTIEPEFIDKGQRTISYVGANRATYQPKLESERKDFSSALNQDQYTSRWQAQLQNETTYERNQEMDQMLHDRDVQNRLPIDGFRDTRVPLPRNVTPFVL